MFENNHWRTGYPTTLHQPLRNFSEVREDSTVWYKLELDMAAMEFKCSATLTQRDGKQESLDMTIEEFFKNYDPSLGKKVKKLKEYSQEYGFKIEDLAELCSISIPTMRGYLKQDRSDLLSYEENKKFPLWVAYVLVADFMPFNWLQPAGISKECNIDKSIINAALERKEYEAIEFRGTRIAPNVVDQIKYNIMEKEEKIDGKKPLYSIPYVGRIAADRYGRIDSLDKNDYAKLYNELFRRIDARITQDGKLKSEFRGVTRYVDEKVREVLLDLMPIEIARRRLEMGLQELKSKAKAFIFDSKISLFVSRGWVAGQLGLYDEEIEHAGLDEATRKLIYFKMWGEYKLAVEGKPYNKEAFDKGVALLASDLHTLLYSQDNTRVIKDTSHKQISSLAVLEGKIPREQLEKIHEITSRYIRTGDGLDDVILQLSLLHNHLTNSK